MSVSYLSRSGWTPSADGSNGANLPANALDGNTATYWSSANLAQPHTFTVNFGSPQTFNTIAIQLNAASVSGQLATYEIYVSNDGVTWGSYVGKGQMPYNNTVPAYLLGLQTPQTAQYVQIKSISCYANTGSLGSNYFSIGEFNVGTWVDDLLTPSNFVSVSMPNLINASATSLAAGMKLTFPIIPEGSGGMVAAGTQSLRSFSVPAMGAGTPPPTEGQIFPTGQS